MTVGVRHLDHAMQITKEWLNEVSDNLDTEVDEGKIYQITKAVLTVLRDRLGVQEAIHLASQFPLVLKGMYFDGWNPANNPIRFRTPQDFFAEVSWRVTDIDVEDATRAVFRMLKNKISPGEIEDIKANFPEELNMLWE